MLGKTEKNPQLNLTETPLIHFINPEHELYRLARDVDWGKVEKEFAPFYSNKGAPSVPIRVMVGLSLLKHMYHYSDKGAISHWLENPYWQHFCGEVHFQHKVPFYYSDFSHFRRRIGKEGEKKITQLGQSLFGHVYMKGITEQGGKIHHTKKRNFIFRAANALGNYLVKISSH